MAAIAKAAYSIASLVAASAGLRIFLGALMPIPDIAGPGGEARGGGLMPWLVGAGTLVLVLPPYMEGGGAPYPA